MSEDTPDKYSRHAKEHAASDPEQWEIDMAFMDEFLDKLPEGSNILDIGSGAGNQAAYFSQRGFRVIISDASPEILGIAHQNSPASESVIIRLPNISLPDESFSAVFSRHVLQHLGWDDFEQSISEISRILQPDGCTALIFPISKTDETIMIPYELENEMINRNFYPLPQIKESFITNRLRIIYEDINVEEDSLSDIRAIFRTILKREA